MTSEQIKIAVKGGVSFVCATCKKFWNGKPMCDAGLQNKQCGGPVSGMTFPEYDGAIGRNDLAQFCFKCGDLSDGAVRVNAERTLIGVCNSCMGDLGTMTIKGRRVDLVIEDRHMEVVQ